MAFFSRHQTCDVCALKTFPLGVGGCGSSFLSPFRTQPTGQYRFASVSAMLAQIVAKKKQEGKRKMYIKPLAPLLVVTKLLYAMGNGWESDIHTHTYMHKKKRKRKKTFHLSDCVCFAFKRYTGLGKTTAL
jgi:hypothetical protein